jgi:excisionase family DNA binding protein
MANPRDNRGEPPARYLKVAEAAEYLRMSRDGVREAIRRGDLPAHRLGEKGHLRILASDLAEALQPHKENGK